MPVWAHLEAARWPQGPVCRRCGAAGDAHFVGRARYPLQRLPKQVQVTHLPIRTWFTALYLVAAARASRGSSWPSISWHRPEKGVVLGQGIRRMMEDDEEFAVRHR
jgi:Transposase zinc-ribbon domain